MARTETDSGMNGSLEVDESGGNSRRSSVLLSEPDYSSPVVQEALEHLATIDLVDLSNEAKVEYCRATRDLRCCGRNVEYVLNSCHHASLCAECSKRCDVCPICRVPISRSGNRVRLRLYYECIEAGLIPKKFDDRIQSRDDEEKKLDADIQRLYSFFDVALKSNLVSLICHYVTDVCMDENAVSSDPVIAFLLDEVVVKDWCNRTFKSIISEIEAICFVNLTLLSDSLTVEEMEASLGSLLHMSAQLSGIINILDILESSFKGAVSAKFEDLHHLQENIQKSKQHMEIMMWCIRHQFLEKVEPRFINYSSWLAHVRNRKSAATERAMRSEFESSIQEGSLFIDDALLNLEGEIHPQDIKVFGGCYPFENLRTATDLLFLHGSSDLVVAKRAIFLYYLFDRHWSTPNENWRHIVEDFAATFCLGRHSLLESLVFYLLDDHSDEALKEACRLLPEIIGPSTHPKIAQVLLERQNPDAALMVLRWSGRDGSPELVSLTEAVIAVRVRVLSGLLTEAFLYQRMICSKVQEQNSKHELHSDALNSEIGNWINWLETLVTELCSLCLWSSFAEQLIDLPWNSDEERYLHKCLIEYAVDDPTSTVGSLLVTFYLKRYRYMEAFQVDQLLMKSEEDFISKNKVNMEIPEKMKSVRTKRTWLIEKCIGLLPEVQRQHIKSGRIPPAGISLCEDIEMHTSSETFKVKEQNSGCILLRSHNHFGQIDSSNEKTMASSISTQNLNSSATKLSEHVQGPLSVLREHLFANAGSAMKPQMSIRGNVQFDDTPVSVARRFSFSDTPLTRKVEKAPSRSVMSSNFLDGHLEVKQNGVIFDQLETVSTPYAKNIASSPAIPKDNIFKNSEQDSDFKSSSKKIFSVGAGKQSGSSKDETMHLPWSNGDLASPNNVNANAKDELRWRTDESSEEEETRTPLRTTSTRRARRSRFARV